MQKQKKHNGMVTLDVPATKDSNSKMQFFGGQVITSLNFQTCFDLVLELVLGHAFLSENEVRLLD